MALASVPWCGAGCALSSLVTWGEPTVFPICFHLQWGHECLSRGAAARIRRDNGCGSHVRSIIATKRLVRRAGSSPAGISCRLPGPSRTRSRGPQRGEGLQKRKREGPLPLAQLLKFGVRRGSRCPQHHGGASLPAVAPCSPVAQGREDSETRPVKGLTRKTTGVSGLRRHITRAQRPGVGGGAAGVRPE